MNEQQRAWEYYNAADVIYAQRYAYSLVAHSMLIAAFAALLAADIQTWLKVWAEHAVAILGLGFSAFMLAVSHGIQKKMYHLVPTLKKDPIYRKYLGKPATISVGFIQTYLTPAVLAAFWSFMLWIAIKH